MRRWRSWHRWVPLAILAHAFLVVAALAEHTPHPPPPERVPVTCNEVGHLFAALAAQPVGDRAHRPRWSAWRRRHQARARTCHHRRQAAWTLKITNYGWRINSVLRERGRSLWAGGNSS